MKLLFTKFLTYFRSFFNVTSLGALIFTSCKRKTISKKINIFDAYFIECESGQNNPMIFH